jgi:hypothetical protein
LAQLFATPTVAAAEVSSGESTTGSVADGDGRRIDDVQAPSVGALNVAGIADEDANEEELYIAIISVLFALALGAWFGLVAKRRKEDEDSYY